MLNESFGIKKGNSIFESDGIPTANASGVSEMQGGLGFVLENPEKDHPEQSCWDAHEKDQKSHEEWKDEQNEELTNPDLEVEKPDGEKEQLLDEDDIDEQQKSVIKVDAPAPAPVEDEVEIDDFATDEGGDEEFESEEEVEDFGEEGEGDEYTKKIQKLTGKVAQLMRDMDEPDPELEKYVINSVISAIDFEEMDDEDVEDIIAKIEGDEDEEGDDFGDEEFGGEEDFGEEDIEAGDEELAESEEKEGEEKEEEGDDDEDEGDKDVDYEDKKERKKHYKGDVEDIEDQIDKLKKDLKRAKKEEEKNESKTFTKKQLVESFLKKNANLALKKVLTENRTICEECMGGGCPSCEENLTEDIEEFDTFDDWRESSYYNSPESDPWDISRGGYDDTNKRYFDRHREKYGPFRIKPWEDSYAGTFGPDDNDLPWIDSKNRHLSEDRREYNEYYGNKNDYLVDEGVTDLDLQSGNDIGVVEQEMDITTALATGQDYLGATGDLDRDGDQIANRLDLDSNNDRRLDHSMDRDDDYIEVGINTIFGDSPAPAEPTTRPGTKPTTTPGTKPRKPRWREITRPGVDPRPKALKERKKSSFKRRGMYK